MLTTFLFEYTCLKVKPTRARIIGCIIVLIGLVVIGLVNYLLTS